MIFLFDWKFLWKYLTYRKLFSNDFGDSLIEIVSFTSATAMHAKYNMIIGAAYPTHVVTVMCSGGKYKKKTLL